MVVLLTGVTGLIGSHLAIALLRAGHRVVVLVRGRRGIDAGARARRTLLAYPGWCDTTRVDEDLRVLEGNVLETDCGIGTRDLRMWRGRVDALAHCAGEVTFSRSPANPRLHVNTTGVRHLSSLATRLACGRLLHVSTAYVDRGLRGLPARTPYEATKLDGERILAREAQTRRLDACVVRPGVVTGDRHHGFAPTFNGIYPFFRSTVRCWPSLRHLPRERWLPPGAPYAGSAVNLLPADYVADVILALLEDGWSAGALNVVNAEPWPIHGLLDLVADFLSAGDAPLRAAADDGWGRALRKLTETYEPYLHAPLEPPSAELRRLVATRGIAPVRNDAAWIHALLRWCLVRNWKGTG